MAEQITLPRLVGTRDAAERLVVESQIPDDLHNEQVNVLSRALAASTISFADEFVRLLANRHAGSLVLFAATEEFLGQVQDSARRRGNIPVRVGTQDDLTAV